MSATPRTDALEQAIPANARMSGWMNVAFEGCRQLERELAEARLSLSDVKAAKDEAFERAAQECESLLTNHGKRPGGSDSADAARRMCALRIRALKSQESPK